MKSLNPQVLQNGLNEYRDVCCQLAGLLENVAMHAINAERWLDEHGDVLFRFALSRVRDASLAEDLVQETFLAAMKSQENFSGQASERTWLIGILKHKIMDSFRRKYRDQIFVSNDDDETRRDFEANGHWDVRGGRAPKSWGDALSAFEREEFRATLDGCLDKLPEKTAGAFAMREMDDLDTEEICKVLNISATNFWVLMHRARTQLRRCLETNWFAK